jgi:SAM-dependent methyltransferase
VSLVPREVLVHITSAERNWLGSVFDSFDGRYPTLAEIWQLMGDAWREQGRDPVLMDERIGKFYAHPVWLLNGLFIERDAQSVKNRQLFTDWGMKHCPLRVADYGGGFGSLASMIGNACPDAVVEVIEPHPHPAAIGRAAATANVRYRPELTGEYDILIATDVFEHVPDPLALVEHTALHLRAGGHYLIANCFWPVILCHLPQTFHFRHSWDAALAAMGLVPGETVCYGRAFRSFGELDLHKGREIEQGSRWLFPWLERLPGHIRHRVARLAFPKSHP